MRGNIGVKNNRRTIFDFHVMRAEMIGWHLTIWLRQIPERAEMEDESAVFTKLHII